MDLDRGRESNPDDLSRRLTDVDPETITPSVGRLSRRGRPAEPLTVNIEFVVLDGAAGKALARHQAAVMREVLQWLHDNPPGEPDADQSIPRGEKAGLGQPRQ